MPCSSAPGTVAVGTRSWIMAVALNKSAREAGLNAAALVKALLGGRGGGSAELA